MTSFSRIYTAEHNFEQKLRTTGPEHVFIELIQAILMALLTIVFKCLTVIFCAYAQNLSLRLGNLIDILDRRKNKDPGLVQGL